MIASAQRMSAAEVAAIRSEIQAREARLHGDKPARGLFWSPRLGKTRGAIRSLESIGGAKRGLVVVPLSTCPQWADELEKAGHRVLRAYEWSRGTKLDRLESRSTEGVMVVSWRSIASQTPAERKQRGLRCEMADALLGWKPQALILDESHAMASPSADQARIARKLAWQTPWRRILTGTPVPNHHGNLWGQLVALDRDEFFRSHEDFMQRYTIRDAMFPTRVLAHVNSDELRAKMLRYVSIERREDYFGPDQWVEEETLLELPPAVRKIYASLAKDWLIDDPSLPLHVDAAHVLARMTRLQQIAAGYVPSADAEGAGVLKELHTVKLDAVTEDLERVVRAGEKAIVFHQFTWEGEQYARRAARLGVPVHRLYGGSSTDERAATVAAMRDPAPKVAVVQTKSGGVGIDFSQVPYQFVTSESYSFVNEEQRHDRTYEPGTPRFIRYYRMDGTVDISIASLLDSKESIHNAVKNADREALAYGRIRRTRSIK